MKLDSPGFENEVELPVMDLVHLSAECVGLSESAIESIEALEEFDDE